MGGERTLITLVVSNTCWAAVTFGQTYNSIFYCSAWFGQLRSIF